MAFGLETAPDPAVQAENLWGIAHAGASARALGPRFWSIITLATRFEVSGQRKYVRGYLFLGTSILKEGCTMNDGGKAVRGGKSTRKQRRKRIDESTDLVTKGTSRGEAKQDEPVKVSPSNLITHLGE